MQILTNQSVIMQNLLYYKCKTQKENIEAIINHIEEQLDTIKLKKVDKIITSIEETKLSQTINLEILVPVDSSFEDNEHFSFLSQFKLIHAIKIRHEGTIHNLTKTKKILEKYLEDHSYKAITKYYNVFVRHNSNYLTDSIIDIYVGINPNILE